MEILVVFAKTMPNPENAFVREMMKLCFFPSRTAAGDWEQLDLNFRVCNPIWEKVFIKVGSLFTNEKLTHDVREAYTQWTPETHQLLPNPLIQRIWQLLLIMNRRKVPRGVQHRIIRTAVLDDYIGHVAPDQKLASIHHFQITDTRVVECPRLEWLKQQPVVGHRHPTLGKYPIHTLHPYVDIRYLYAHPETYYYAATLIVDWDRTLPALRKWVMEKVIRNEFLG
jgi:hypothetical protein